MAKKLVEAVKKVVTPKEVVVEEVKVEDEFSAFEKRHPGANPAVIYE